jgi:hypothetical protein
MRAPARSSNRARCVHEEHGDHRTRSLGGEVPRSARHLLTLGEIREGLRPLNGEASPTSASSRQSYVFVASFGQRREGA